MYCNIGSFQIKFWQSTTMVQILLSIVIALSVAFIFNDTITVREGTVIGMLIFGPMLDRIMRFVKTKT
jgi:uncharacterized membrane protein YczE